MVEILDSARLAEMGGAEHDGPVPPYPAEPGQRGGAPVDHRHDDCVAGHAAEEPPDVAGRERPAGGAHAPGGLPALVEAISRGDGKDADVAPVGSDHAGGGNRLGGDGALIGDDKVKTSA